MSTPNAPDLVFQADSFAAFWEIFKFRQPELSALTKACVEARRVRIADVNGRQMIFEGLGWEHAEIAEVLKAAGAAFNPQYVRKAPADGSTEKEYKLSVRYPWAQDRVM
ncbi:MAG: hypothetical protein HS116_17830 [Planctomycetes bacterium]|nr:hypothetical protein [Planctomycetota bacterium]